jgi:hypothetical protein
MAFPINPPRVALVDSNNLCTSEWYSFFSEIQKMLGQSAGNPFDEAVLTAGAMGVGDASPPAPVYLLSVVEPGALTAGSGLTGGGNMANNLTVTVGAGTGITVNANDVQLDTAHVRNVDHSAVTMTAGAGLTGGGTIEATRTLDVGAGAGITVNANDVALDTASTRNTDHAGVTLTAGAGLTGGGTIESNRTFDVGAGTGVTVNANDVALDTSHARNVDHSAVTITAGAGLTGGGTIEATRTLDIGAGTGITVNANDVALTVQTAYGTYTPTLTNTTNLDGSTAYSCQYLRVGDVVTVSGRVDANPTAAGATALGISLPIASNFTLAGVSECAGVAFAASVAGQGANISADVTNDRANMQWVAVDTANRDMIFTFTYRVV